ncbi:uncharacterized protein si:ch73-144l3.2 [Danio rerio]|uniref:Uncharacterized protein si:ch73-144l3.2 n=2 Tax=Danio rerio TaxID=7955 RepID=A0A8M9Q507_DANRE
MDHPYISLVLLIFMACSSSAGKTFWTHQGTRCIEDCKAYWGAYKCKTIDKDGQCQTMYCSPKENVDYWGRQCSETSKCWKRGKNYSSKTGFLHWGYCGLVMDDNNHYGSYTDAQCYDNCEQRGESYYWCHTEQGWDYCSPNENTDYMNKQCKEDRPCAKRNSKYYWCAVEETWGYCGLVKPKMFYYWTYENSVCIDVCHYYERGDYYWCHTDKGWDYCSPEVDVTYKGTPCRSDHFCGLHGYSYNWCWTSGSGYDYCGPIESAECSYFPSTHLRRGADDNNPQKIVICTKADKGNKKITIFTANPDPDDIADGSKFKHEVENLVSQWDNGYLVDQARSNLLRSADVRIDMQGLINRNNLRYYNLQVQRNVPRRAGESTTVSQIIVPPGVPARYIRRAFIESLRMRAQVFIDVSTSNLDSQH